MEQEKQTEKEDISVLYDRLIQLEPKLVTNFVPENASEQKNLFLSDEIRNPKHNYDRLDAVNFSNVRSQINQTGLAILSHDNLNPKHRVIYEDFITGYNERSRLMELAHLINHSDNQDERVKFEQEFMSLNIEIYGEPAELTYRSLLQEKMGRINKISLDESASSLRSELFVMAGYDPDSKKVERFKPSTDTVDWMHEITESLYSGMLSHIPEKEIFTASEVQSIFAEIINEEFGEAAEGWKVDLEEAKSINVKTTEKRIVIPIDRAEIKYDKLRKLVVHEIGVHLLRNIMGAETDMLPLGHGLSDYYDSEEGIADVMENALDGKFVEGGTESYISAGLIYCDKKDFRDAFEIKWRLDALTLGSVKKTGILTDEDINKAKEKAYSGVMRFMRGTDRLPWFKDLAYYDGAMKMWQYLEEIKGDDIKFMFLLDGKADPSSIKHQRLVYEAKNDRE